MTPRSRSALLIGATAVAAFLVAEGAVLLLRPRAELLEPVAVSAGDYFDAAQVERAEDFRDGQRLLGLGGLAVSGAVLVALSLGRPRAARRALERLGRRPVLGAAAAGAGLSVVIAVVGLPLAAIAHERAVDVGLSTQSLAAWLGDEAKAVAIAAVLTGAGAAILLALVRRLPRGWWAVAAGGVVTYAVISQALAPVLLAPLFNDFEKLEPGPARETVVELADSAGVEIGEIYEVDASRRSTALNAYVSGLGPTKRVVVYDNLLAWVEQEGRRRPSLSVRPCALCSRTSSRTRATTTSGAASPFSRSPRRSDCLPSSSAARRWPAAERRTPARPRRYPPTAWRSARCPS